MDALSIPSILFIVSIYLSAGLWGTSWPALT